MAQKPIIFKVLSIIAVLLLLNALTKNPYAYYIFMRWFISGIFLANIYYAIMMRNKTWLFIWVISLIIYNPIISIHLTRGIWSVINLASIVLIVASLFYQKQYEQSTNELMNKLRNLLDDNKRYLPNNDKKLLK